MVLHSVLNLPLYECVRKEKGERKTGAICGNFVICSTFERELFRDFMFIIMQRWLRHKKMKKKYEWMRILLFKNASIIIIKDNIWHLTSNNLNWDEMKKLYGLGYWQLFFVLCFTELNQFERETSITYWKVSTVDCTTMSAISSKTDGMFKRAKLSGQNISNTFDAHRTSWVALILHFWSSFAYEMYVKTQ